MENKLEIEKKYILSKRPFHNSDGMLDITQRYGDGFRIRHTYDRIAKSHKWTHTIMTDVDYNEFSEEVETTISEYEFGKYIKDTTKALSKIRVIFKREDGLKWEVDMYHGIDLVMAELEMPTEDYKFEIDNWMQDVIVEDVTYSKDYNNFNLAFKQLTLNKAEILTKGDKVIFITDGNTHDFGYIGGTGKVIIYKEGEHNMQDSFAVDHWNVSLVE